MPEVRIAVVPMGQMEIVPDSWQVSGLRGTGSNDVMAHDVFVPEERTAAIALAGAGSSNGEYRIPMFTLFGLALVPVALGAARRAIDELLAMAQGKTPMLSAAKLRDKPIAQYEIARAEGSVQAGRAYLYETVEELMDRARRKDDIDMPLRARVKLACAHATESAAQAVEVAYRLGGGTSNFEHSPLQRCQRDVHAVTQHFVISAANYEAVGRVLMGLDPGTPII